MNKSDDNLILNMKTQIFLLIISFISSILGQKKKIEKFMGFENFIIIFHYVKHLQLKTLSFKAERKSDKILRKFIVIKKNNTKSD